MALMGNMNLADLGTLGARILNGMVIERAWFPSDDARILYLQLVDTEAAQGYVLTVWTNINAGETVPRYDMEKCHRE